VNCMADDKLAHVVPDRHSAEHYRHAFDDKRGIAVLNGLTSAQAEPLLARAVVYLEEHAERLNLYPQKLFAHEYASPFAALDALRALYRTTALFPDAVWTIEGGAP
jgi:hypothetical protein